MKKVRLWCGFGAALALVSGCYVEQTRDEEQDAAKRKRVASEGHAALDQDVGTCKFTLTKGCFDGHVSAKTAFFIDGKQFFNGDDLATRFKELINVQEGGKKLSEGKDGYDLKLLTPLDNISFLQGFSYDATGPLARSGNIRSDGNFSIDELPEGNYDLRVQKSVKFTLTANLPADPKPTPPVPATPAGTSHALLLTAADANAPQNKVYCATIYADASLNIRAGQRLWNEMREYRLHITDNQCMNGGNQTVLTL